MLAIMAETPLIIGGVVLVGGLYFIMMWMTSRKKK